MAQQTINIGTLPNDGTGDTIRNAFDKVNDNFDEIYTGLSLSSNSITVANTVIVGNSTVNTVINSSAISVTSILANGSLGTAGHVLHSNGSTIYWAIDDAGTGTVTSVATGNGLTGGPVTTTGTVSILANSGIIANSTGIFVDDSYINTISSNTSTFLVGNTVSTNTTSLLVGNSTVNAIITDSSIKFANSTASANLTLADFTIGISTVNTTMMSVGSDVLINASAMLIGNSTVNTTVNSSIVQIANATSSGLLDTGTLVLGNSIVNTTVNSSTITVSSANVTTNTFTLGASSGTANGYTVLPNALKFQWGNYTDANSTANVVSFNTAFTTNVYSVTVTSNTAEATHMPAVTAINSTSFTVVTANTTSSTVYWQAIGV